MAPVDPCDVPLVKPCGRQRCNDGHVVPSVRSHPNIDASRFEHTSDLSSEYRRVFYVFLYRDRECHIEVIVRHGKRWVSHQNSTIDQRVRHHTWIKIDTDHFSDTTFERIPILASRARANI